MHMIAPDTGLSRRSFLKTDAAAGGGLLIEPSLPGARARDAVDRRIAPNAFIGVGREGTVTLKDPKDFRLVDRTLPIAGQPAAKNT